MSVSMDADQARPQPLRVLTPALMYMGTKNQPSTNNSTRACRKPSREGGVRKAWPGGRAVSRPRSLKRKGGKSSPTVTAHDVTYIPLEDCGGDARSRPGARQPHEVAAADVAGEEGGAHLESESTDAGQS